MPSSLTVTLRSIDRTYLHAVSLEKVQASVGAFNILRVTPLQ